MISERVMLARNIEFNEMRLVAEKILSSNLVSPVTDSHSEHCDMCGQHADSLYGYFDGYNHLRLVCGCCGLLNIPFTGNKFRINNIPKGFLVIDHARLNITVITNSVNTDIARHKQIIDIDWVESKGDLYETLISTIKQSPALDKKRYVIEMGRRMHQYMHLAKASYGNHVHIATEETGIHINMDLIDRIMENNGLNAIDSVIDELLKHLGYLDKCSLVAYKSIIKGRINNYKV